MSSWSVYLPPDGAIWWASVYTPSGKRIRRSTRCRGRKAAEAVAARIWREAEQAHADACAGITRAAPEAPPPVPLGELVRGYLKRMRDDHRSPTTVATYATHLRTYVLPHFGAETDARTIDRQAVETFRAALSSGELSSLRTHGRRSADGRPSPATVNRVMVALRRMLDFGQRAAGLEVNAAAHLPPVRERPEDKYRALTDAEVNALAAELARNRRRGDHVAWLRFACATGLRDDELQTLTWADVDEPRRRARVTAQRAKGARTRWVPLTAEAMAALATLTNPDRTGPVFGPADRRQALAGAWERTGLPGRCPSAHDLRNTAASRCAAAGFDLAQMMAMFSWLSPATAQRYIHLYGRGWEAMAAKLDGLGK